MGLTDLPARPALTAADGATQIRRLVRDVQNSAVGNAKQIGAIVTKYGRTEIDAALGVADAAQLVAIYSTIQATVATAVRPADLPE